MQRVKIVPYRWLMLLIPMLVRSNKEASSTVKMLLTPIVDSVNIYPTFALVAKGLNSYYDPIFIDEAVHYDTGINFIEL